MFCCLKLTNFSDFLFISSCSMPHILSLSVTHLTDMEKSRITQLLRSLTPPLDLVDQIITHLQVLVPVDLVEVAQAALLLLEPRLRHRHPLCRLLLCCHRIIACTTML